MHEYTLKPQVPGIGYALIHTQATSPSDCKHIQATQFSDQIPRTYPVTYFRHSNVTTMLPFRENGTERRTDTNRQWLLR